MPLVLRRGQVTELSSAIASGKGNRTPSDGLWLIEQPGVFTPDPTMLTHRLCCALRALGKGSPPQPPLWSTAPPTQLGRQGERCKTPSDGLRPPAPPAQLRWQGERCISTDISRYKRKIRVYRFDLSRVGPCVRPQPSYISVEWSLLSKGLRGGKERSDRVESLLRWMIASEDAKNPLQVREQKGIQGYGLLYPPVSEG